MQINPINVNCDAPANDELIVSPSAEQTASNMAFIRREGRNRRVRFLKRTTDANHPFTDADIDPGSVVSMAIGTPDAAPTSGLWGFSYNGDPSNLTALSYGISAADLETAMNSNIEIANAGAVTVQSATPGSWIVTWGTFGAKLAFLQGANTLVPLSLINFRVIRAGSMDGFEIVLITLRQNYLAFSNDFAPTASGTIAADHIQIGDASQPDIYRISISGDVDGGTWLLNRTQAGIYRITPQPNFAVGARAAWLVSGFTSGTLATLSGQWVDLQDAAGPVRFWLNINGGGVAPTAPVGGRNVSVAFVSPNPSGNPDDQYLWGLMNAAISGDAAGVNFDTSALAVSSGISVYSRTQGRRATAGSSGILTCALTSPGAEGPYQSTAFVLSDRYGTVAVWFNVAGTGTLPAIAAAADRAIEITTVTDGMTASAIVDALVAVLDADAEFAVTDGGTYAELTMSFAGTRDAPSNGDAPVGIATIRAGSTLSASFPFNATGGGLQQFIGDAYAVTTESEGVWDLVAVTNGASAVVAVNGDGLTFSAVWEGTFDLSTVNLFVQFAENGSIPISSKFEIQVVEPSGQTAKLYQGDCEIRPDVIDVDNLVSPGAPNPSNNITFLSSVTGLTGGGGSNLDGVSTLGVTTPRVYQFRHATAGVLTYVLAASTFAESSPNIIRPDDYAGGSNEKVFFLSSPLVFQDDISVNGKALASNSVEAPLLKSTDNSGVQFVDVANSVDTTLFGNVGGTFNVVMPAGSGVLALAPDFTDAGTTGAQTINKHAGSVQFAAAATSLVVTNSLVTTTSNIGISLLTADATAVLGSVVPAAGSFTISMKVAPTGTTRVGFQIVVP